MVDATQQAKLEDTGSSEVPNDYYLVDEGHRDKAIRGLHLRRVQCANSRFQNATGPDLARALSLP